MSSTILPPHANSFVLGPAVIKHTHALPPRTQLYNRSCSNKHTRPGAPDPLMVGIRSPDGLVIGSCTSHPGVLGSIPKREEPGKTGAPCVKVPGSSRVPAPPWVGSRSPDGWDQIPYRPGGWVLHQPPWSFGFDSQTKGTRENRRTLCKSTGFLTGPKPQCPRL